MRVYEARWTREIKRRTVIKKQHSTIKKNSFHQQIGRKFKEETFEVLHLEHTSSFL
jgi:hypothetical protein